MHPITFNRLSLNFHDKGGATCVSLACTQKNLMKSVVVLDGYFYPLTSKTRKQGSSAPMLMVSSHKWESAKWQCPYRLELYEMSKKTAIFMMDLILMESNHQNFCDSHYIASHFLMKGGAMLGSKDNPKDVIDAIDASLAGFMKCYLTAEEEDAQLLNAKESNNLENYAAIYYLSKQNQRSMKPAKIRQQLNYIKTRAKSSLELKRLQQLQHDTKDMNGLMSARDDTIIYDDSLFKKTNAW